MVLKLSNRSENIVQSEIRNMSIECDKVNGVNLSQGICDLETPSCVKQSAEKAIDEGINHYTRYDGLPELRRAISRKLKIENGISVDPERNIIVSGGATGALYSACLALLNPKDEVIVFEPYYGYHVNTLLASNAVPRYSKLKQPDWEIDFKGLEKLINRRTKAIIINTPANPSGKVFSRIELKKLAEFAKENDLFIFTDEIYEYFVYNGGKHISPGSIEEIADRTITISGYSKTFSTTGWRIGYAACDEKWAKMIGYVSDLIYVCAPTPLQIGIANGIEKLSSSFYKNLCKTYQNKRDLICSTLEDCGLNPHIPQGAYYVLADISRLPGKTSKDKAMNLLERTGVACVPGSAFYHDGDKSDGKNLARFCFAKTDKDLEEAFKKLKTL